jgi:hypothetical protein
MAGFQVTTEVFGSHSPLAAADSVNGLLLGSFSVPLPVKYKDRERILAELTLFSTEPEKKGYSTSVKLTVARGPKTRNAVHEAHTLFESKDAQLV